MIATRTTSGLSTGAWLARSYTTYALKPMMDPTDRSRFPVSTTNVWPAATIARIAAVKRMLCTLPQPIKRGTRAVNTTMRSAWKARTPMKRIRSAADPPEICSRSFSRSGTV